MEPIDSPMAEPGEPQSSPRARQGAAEPGGSAGGFIPARDGIDPRNAARIVLGLIAVTVAVLASLALLESFVLQPAPGQGPDEGAPREEGGGNRGGVDVTCKEVADFLKWTTFLLGAASATLLGVGIARRHKNNGEVGSSAWGILSILLFFFALVALGAWRITASLCEEAPSCRRATNGTYTAFLLLLTLTLASVAFGIFRAWQARKNYFATGWGVLATVLYLPTILVGFTWYLIRLFCSPDLSCAARDEFLDVLAWMFWLGLLGGLAAVAAGFVFHKKWKLGIFGSGWGVLAVKLVLLAAFSGYGWIYVDGLHILGCDPPPEELEIPDVPTCEEIRDDLQDKIGLGMWILGGLLVVAIGAGIFVHRERLKEFFRSPFAIAAYILVGLLVLAFLGYLLVGSMCGQGEGDQSGQDGSGAGDTDQGGGTGSGSGPGTGGGGSDTGSPGGAGGTGPTTPVDISIDPRGFLWFVIALAVVLGLVLLVSLLRKRQLGGFGAPPAAVPEQVEVKASETDQLLRMLDARNLTSTEAVIAAYRAFLAWGEGRGLGKHEEETPREHAHRVLGRFPVAEDTMDEFVTAYEVARLSAREPTPDERAKAVQFSKRFVRPGVVGGEASVTGGAAPPRAGGEER